MDGMSWFQTINHVVKWGTYGWDLLFQTMNQLDKRGHLGMGSHVYKQ